MLFNVVQNKGVVGVVGFSVEEVVEVCWLFLFKLCCELLEGIY